MSNFLKASREEIKLQLRSVLMLNRQDIQIYEYIPERPNTPCFIVTPGSPYVTQGNAFCDFQTRFEVLILADKSTNETATDLLDQLVTESLDALETWYIEEVEVPQAYEINGALLLGTKVQITADKSL